MQANQDVDVLAEADKVRSLLGNNGNVIVRKSGTEPLIKVKIMGANYDEICYFNEQIRQKFVKYKISRTKVVK